MTRDVAKPVRAGGEPVNKRAVAAYDVRYKSVTNALPCFLSVNKAVRRDARTYTPLKLLQKMDDEKLIELVRKYEFLYNLQHPKYIYGFC